jgi:hypothetical protein
LKKKSIGNAADVSEAKNEQRTSIKRHLVREFGQTKGRRAAEQIERMKVDCFDI